MKAVSEVDGDHLPPELGEAPGGGLGPEHQRRPEELKVARDLGTHKPANLSGQREREGRAHAYTRTDATQTHKPCSSQHAHHRQTTTRRNTTRVDHNTAQHNKVRAQEG